MIVVMAAGMSADLTVNPLKTVTAVTVQIVTLLVGDQEHVFHIPYPIDFTGFQNFPLGLIPKGYHIVGFF